MAQEYTVDELFAMLDKLEAQEKEDAKYINDGSICPHCDSTGRIDDVSTNTDGKFFWCNRCGASWSYLLPGGYHKYRGTIHEKVCHAVR